MCKYCKDFNKGNGEGVTSLETSIIPMGIFEDGYVELEMSIEEKGGTMTAWFSHGDDNIGASFEIKYCPMCGRKLEN